MLGVRDNNFENVIAWRFEMQPGRRMSAGTRITRAELRCHPSYVDSKARADSRVFTCTAFTYPACRGEACYYASHVLFS